MVPDGGANGSVVTILAFVTISNYHVDIYKMYISLQKGDKYVD